MIFDPDKAVAINEHTTEVEVIYIKDVTVETIGGNAIYMCGLPEPPFKNIYLENVKAHGKYGMKVKNIGNLQLIDVNVTFDEES